MKTNVLSAGYTPAAGINLTGRVKNGIEALRAEATNQVKNLCTLLDCPIETEADAHYVKGMAACFFSLIFPPLLAVAAYQLLQAKEKEGRRRSS